MEKENIFSVGGEEKRRSKRKTIFGEGKYIFVAAKKTEKKKEDFFLWRRKRGRMKMWKIFGERKH